MRRTLTLSAVCAACAGALSSSVMAEEVDNVHELNILVNGTFEIGSVCNAQHTDGTYAYKKDASNDPDNPTVLPTGWTFSDEKSGITKTSDTAWHPRNLAAAGGSDWAVFLQENEYKEGGTIAQEVEFPRVGSYTLEFMWVGRQYDQPRELGIGVRVSLDGDEVAATARTSGDCPYTAYEKVEIALNITSPGKKTLTIGQIMGYGSVCIDQVALYPTATFTVDIPETVYRGDDGLAVPAVVVTDKETGAVLKEGTGYTVEYANNNTYGTGTITVRAKAPNIGVVTRTFEIPGVYFAVPDDEVGAMQSGISWGTAMTYANALKRIAAEGGELWLKAGRYTLSASPDVFVSDKAVRLRGGFAGDPASPDRRDAGAMTVIDGQDTYQTLKVQYTATPSLFYIERMSFQHSAGKGLYMELPKGLETDIATHAYIVDCDFSNNTLFGTDKPDTGLGLYLRPGYTSCVISNCTFQGNVSDATGTKYGYGAYVDGDVNVTKGRVFFESCSFITNGCPDGVTGTAGVGAAFCTKTKPLTLRGCRIVGNRSAVNGNAGIAAFDYQCPEGHAITNCVFVGNQMIAGGGTKGYSSGVVVVRYYGEGQKNQAVDVANCTFAYNIAHYHDQAACAATAHIGTLHFINSIFYGNVINNTASGGADLTANNNGSVTAEYCLFGADADPAGANYGWHFKKDAYDAGRITLGEGNIYGDPRFVSGMSAFTALTVFGTASPKADVGVPPAFRVPFSPDILALNVHLRGAHGYMDEVTGEHRSYVGKSVAIDAGDPQSDYANEPESNGRRVNMGAYGNTPYATQSSYAGLIIRMR